MTVGFGLHFDLALVEDGAAAPGYGVDPIVDGEEARCEGAVVGFAHGTEPRIGKQEIAEAGAVLVAWAADCVVEGLCQFVERWWRVDRRQWRPGLVLRRVCDWANAGVVNREARSAALTASFSRRRIVAADQEERTRNDVVQRAGSWAVCSATGRRSTCMFWLGNSAGRTATVVAATGIVNGAAAGFAHTRGG